MRRIVLILSVSFAVAVPAGAQVLVTGETGGSGSQAIIVTANLITVKDFSTLANYWAEYAYGLADRVDVFAVYGNISVFEKTQHYVGGGATIALLRRADAGVDVSFFNTVTAPINRRDQASTVLLTTAFVASRPVKAGSFAFTPYGGVDALVPIGHHKETDFTPVETLPAAVVGAAIPLNKTWTAFVEYNWGPQIKSGGIAIVVGLPRLQ